MLVAPCSIDKPTWPFRGEALEEVLSPLTLGSDAVSPGRVLPLPPEGIAF
jgi:hypothetical protein